MASFQQQMNTISAEELAALIDTKILLPAAVKQAQSLVNLTAKNSEYRAEHQASLEKIKARWESEAPVREARAKLEAAGWRKSDYKIGQWYHRKTKRSLPLVEAIKEANLAQ